MKLRVSTVWRTSLLSATWEQSSPRCNARGPNCEMTGPVCSKSGLYTTNQYDLRETQTLFRRGKQARVFSDKFLIPAESEDGLNSSVTRLSKALHHSQGT